MLRRSPATLVAIVTSCWIGFAALVGAACAETQGGGDTSTLRVRGEGVVRVAPDQVEIDFAVVSEAKEADAAAQANARIQSQVVAALEKVLAGKGQVSTQGYSLRPRMHYPRDGTPTIQGYTASNTVRVRSEQLETSGALIDAAISNGANQVQRLHFGLADPAALRGEALAAAARDARSKAEAMAAALGMKISRVLHVEEEGLVNRPPPQPHMRTMARAEAADAATPIEAADVELRATVVLTAEVLEDSRS